MSECAGCGLAVLCAVCCVGRCAVQICSRCLQSPSSRRYRGSCCRLTPKPPRTFLRHLPSSNNCCCTQVPSPFYSSVFFFGLLHLNLLPTKEALGIWKLTLTVCCFRERASCFAMFWVAGEGMGLCLAFLASLILSSSKQGHQTARSRTDKKPK